MKGESMDTEKQAQAKARIAQMREAAKILTHELGLPPEEMGNVLFMMYSDMLLPEALDQAEQSIQSQQTKSQLQDIIETWEEFLIDINHIPVRLLPVISQVAKTSPAPTQFSLEEQITEFIRSYPSYVPGILSSSKVEPNSPVTITDDPEY